MSILIVTKSDPAAFAALALELADTHRLGFAATPDDAIAQLQADSAGTWSLVVCDEELSGDGLTKLVAAAAPAAVVVSSARPTLPFTLAGLRAGARDVLVKPVSADRLRELSESASAPAVPLIPAPTTATESVIGESPAMLDAFRLAVRAAESDLPVLIVGETGTGKELLARVIHENSARAGRPLVAVNCAAIPAHLLESELFGHEPGALPNTFGRRVGRVQRAHGGSLFLDEITSLPPSAQARLVTLLQAGVVEPVGGDASEPVNVRLIAATHHDPGEAVARHGFRTDLFYALAGQRIELPPLRERGDDIGLLAEHFLHELSTATGRIVHAIEPAALDRLRRARWPGNIRQLRSVLARAIMFAEGEVLRVSHLPTDLISPAKPARATSGEFISLAELERQHIEQALALTGGHLGQAARLLGIHRNTLRRKLETYQMPDRQEPE